MRKRPTGCAPESGAVWRCAVSVRCGVVLPLLACSINFQILQYISQHILGAKGVYQILLAYNFFSNRVFSLREKHTFVALSKPRDKTSNL